MAFTLLLAMAQLCSSRLVQVPDLPAFPFPGEETVTVLPPIEPGFAFDQAICSWNIGSPAGAAIKIEARTVEAGTPSGWFTLGKWSPDATLAPRESQNGQKDHDGQVLTDTLVANKLVHQLQLRLSMSNLGTGKPTIKLLTVSFLDSKAAPSADPATPSPAWGKVLDVPEKSQGAYPRGGVLCSPTSVSMTLGFWAKELNRPDLAKDVPEIESNVWDNVYSGAGNWPFNTAYVGSLPGMTAYVSRLNAISDLEQWIQIGVPVVCSVSFDMIRGLPLSPQESGHLVVLVGFDKNGDPVFNDPAYKTGVHRTYKRADFEKAWLYSKRTVYLIYPETHSVPEDPLNLWVSKS